MNHIIHRDSPFFNNDLFKSVYLDKTHILKIDKQHIEYIVSPYDHYLTFNINISRRSILHRQIIKNILNKLITCSFLYEDVSQHILNFIGYDINDIYVDCKLQRFSMYSKPQCTLM